LVIWRCSLVFCLVKRGMAIYHHHGDILSTDFSPESAFFFTWLRGLSKPPP
jgi:hypothetical protein